MPDAPSPEPDRPLADNIHASCVAIDDQGILLLGPSGSGKSDLALRLMDRGAMLVADDRCDIGIGEGRIHASAPASLAGMLEVRGIGIIRRPYQKSVAIALAVELVPRYDRYPLAKAETCIAGHPLPFIRIDAFEMSAPIKILLALENSGLRP